MAPVTRKRPIICDLPYIDMPRILQIMKSDTSIMNKY